MITRRDKLLNLPWEQRRYENHIRKVQSALPVIDNRPPQTRNHVSIKLKHKQKEEERCAQIEKDNLLLLQKLDYIMRTSRVDNYKTFSQTNPLRRIALYANIATKQEPTANRKILNDYKFKEIKSIRKLNCFACTPQSVTETPIPEKRMPWPPPKHKVGRFRSKSVPSYKISLPSVPEISSSTVPTTPENTKHTACEKTLDFIQINNISNKSTESIVLSTGNLVLAINFPSNSFIKLKNGNSEKSIKRGLCQCRKFCI